MRILLICFLIAFVRENAAQDLSAIAVFSISGVSGHVSFHQNSSGYSTLITLSITGIENGTNATWTICRSWLPLSPQSCQNDSLCETFDPTGRLAVENYASVCNSGNTTGCALGDLSGRHGLLKGDLQSLNLTDNKLTLFTSDSVIGRALVIELPNGTRACANIDLPMSPVSAIAPFRDSSNDVIGNIWFVEYLLTRPFTVVYIDVFANTVASDRTWFVGQNLVSSGDCSSVGSVYNPKGAASSSECSTSNQLACPVGNLTEKNGPLLFKNSVSRSLFHDFNLPVAEDSGGYSVVNRSLSLTSSDASSRSCGDILSLLPRVATAIFDVEGVTGAITFTQATPFHPTYVKVELQGLNKKASGYHIHVLPTGPSQTDCGLAVTGGHFNPGNVGPVPPEATRDMYEVGDLSGKFNTLFSLDSVNSSFNDLYIPLFGSNSVIGRSIVIHYPNGSRWICANLTHSQPTTNLVVNLNNSGVVGQVVFTQLQGDPLSETVVFVNFKDFPPIVVPSSSPLDQTSTIGVSSTAEESTIAMPTTTSNMVADQTEVIITTRSLEATPLFTQTMTSLFTTLPTYTSSSITSETMVTSSSPLERSSSGILGSSAAAVQPSEQSSVTVSSVTEISAVPTSTSDIQVVLGTSLTLSLPVMLSSLSSSAAPTQSVSGSTPTSSATPSPLSVEDTFTPTTPTTSSVDNTPTVTTSSQSTADDTSSLVLSTPTFTTSTSSIVGNTPTSTTSSRLAPDSMPSSVMDMPTPTSPTTDTSPVLLGTSTQTAEHMSIIQTSVESTTSFLLSSSVQSVSNSAPSTDSMSPSPSSSSPGRSRRSAFSSSNQDQVIRSRRQVPIQQPVSWSIRSRCDAPPLISQSGCSQRQPLACQPGDLNGKHGQLTGDQSQVFTDLYLPLSGDGSIEGFMLVLDFGSGMSVCASVETLVARPTTPTAQPSPSPSPSSSPSPPPPIPPDPGSLSPSTVIGIVIAVAVGIVVLLVLIIAIVVFCYCRGKKSRKFSISHLSGENGSVELSSLKYTPAASPISRYAQQYRVIEDHVPTDDSELHLVVGDLVRVTEMSEVSPDKGTEGEMWKGVVGEREGWFPPSKVEPVPLEELNLSNEERMQTMKQRNIDLAAAVIISASKSFSTNTNTVKKPGHREGSKEKKVNRDEKIPRSKSLGAVKGVKVRTRDSPAPSDPKKSNDPGRKRVSTSSLPWITVHNVTKDQIDSTPVSLKKLGQAGNHNSYVSDDVNVILADVPSSSPVVPPTGGNTSADEVESSCPSPLPPVFGKVSSRGSKEDKQDDVLSKPATYGYRASFAFTGQSEDDLAFDEGDIINVTWAEDSGWWYGSVNDQEGWFPGGFVEPLEDNLSYSEGDWSPRSLESPSFEFHNFEDDRPKSVISTDMVKPLEGDLNEDDVVVKMDGDREERSVQEKTQDDTLNTTGDFTSEIMGLLAAKTAEKTTSSETQQREKPSAAESPLDSKPRVNASVGQRSPKPKSSPRIEHQGGALEDLSTSKVEVENSVKEIPTKQGDTRKEPLPKTRRKPPLPPVKGDVNKQQTVEPVKRNENESLAPTREDEIKSEVLEEPKEKASPKKARRRAPTAPSGKVKLVKVKDEPTARSNVRRPAPRPPQGRTKQPSKSSPDKLRRNRPIPPPPSIPCPPPPVTSQGNPPVNPPVNPPANPPARNDSPLALHVNKQGPVKPSPIPAQRRKIEIVHLTSGVDGTPPSDSSKIQQSDVAQLNQNAPTKNVESTAKLEEKPSDVPQTSTALTLDMAASTGGQTQDRTKEGNVTSAQLAERVGPSSEVKKNVTTPPAKSKKPATKPKPALKPKPKISITKVRKPEKESLHQPHPVPHGDKTTPEGTSGAGVSETRSSPKPVPRPRPPPRGSSLSSIAVTSVEKSPTSDTQTTPRDETANVESSGIKNTHHGDEGVHGDNTKTKDLQSETKPLASNSIDSPSQPAVAQVPDSKTQEKSPKPSPPTKPSPPKTKPKIVLKSPARVPPAPPKTKPKIVLKSPARVPPAPPTASRQKNIVTVPQKVKVVRPVRSPVLGEAVEHTKQSTSTAEVSSTPGSVDLKGKPPRPPPPRTQNVPNTSTFFPTPVPRSKVEDPASSSGQEPPSANLRRVISPYVARESDQLTLSLGDSVSEIKPANKAGFCYGMLDNGQTGLYPSDCVEIW